MSHLADSIESRLPAAPAGAEPHAAAAPDEPSSLPATQPAPAGEVPEPVAAAEPAPVELAPAEDRKTRRTAELAELRVQVTRGLDDVRAAFLQVIDHHALAVTDRLDRLEEAVRRERDEALARRLGEGLQAMREQIAGLRVKPEKGRRRDLKRIAELLEALEEIADGWD